MDGNGDFKHEFLVLGEIPEKLITAAKKNENPANNPPLVVASLPDSCLIVDPWLRCKFPPSKASIYWEGTNELFNWKGDEKPETFHYKCHIRFHIKPDPIIRRELLCMCTENNISIASPTIDYPRALDQFHSSY